MASEVAKQMAARLFVEGGTKPRRAARLVLAFDGDEKFRGHSGWSELPVSDELDVTLQEVRDVLDGLQSLGHKDCWCRFTKNKEHSLTCQRARQIADQLRVG